ncbi:MAG: hypothetical protein IJD14_02090 [Christensenellaceae bacterium]|nr:hypothetical protein [Christensenellaceae bacterium]
MEENNYFESISTLAEFNDLNSAEGVLKVQASLANGDIPVEGVNVVVYKDLSDGRWVFFDGKTDKNGIIDLIRLPAPPYEQPTIDNVAGAYASYDLRAEKEGYNSMIKRLNIFSGIRTLQPLELEIKEEY